MQPNIILFVNKMTDDSEDILLSEVVTLREHERAAHFFLRYAGSKEAALNFLDACIDVIDPTRSTAKSDNKRDLSQVGSDNFPQPSKILKQIGPPEECADELISDVYLNDSVDDLTITSIILVPNDMSLCAHIIGKQGAGVNEIKRRSNIKCQIGRIMIIKTAS